MLISENYTLKIYLTELSHWLSSIIMVIYQQVSRLTRHFSNLDIDWIHLDVQYPTWGSLENLSKGTKDFTDSQHNRTQEHYVKVINHSGGENVVVSKKDQPKEYKATGKGNSIINRMIPGFKLGTCWDFITLGKNG